MAEAIAIHNECAEECRDFRIMTSPMQEEALILRWTTIDLSDWDNPIQTYNYRCFKNDGTIHPCQVYYTDQEEANAFFDSLETHHDQLFAKDHLGVIDSQ